MQCVLNIAFLLIKCIVLIATYQFCVCVYEKVESDVVKKKVDFTVQGAEKR